MAAVVNGEGISQANLEAELARYLAAQKAFGNRPDETEARQKVLAELVDRTLLSQAAVQNGFTLDASGLQARLDNLAAAAGGVDKLQSWEKDHGYTEESFRAALRLEAAAAWERDQIIKAVPTTADQVHVRQILTTSEESAKKVQANLNSGADFATLALKYDPVSGGDLGWFPKGFLKVPEVDAAAFSLQAGQTSEIIKSSLGFHILQVIERDPQHPLSPEALRQTQEKAVQTWLEDERAKSKIEMLP